MKLTPLNCPTCGQPAEALFISVPGRRRLTMPADDNAVYRMAEADLDWDSEQEETNDAGQLEVVCYDGHGWHATKEDDDA